MRIHRSFTVAAVASVLLLTPMVSAWSSYGSYEPDTIYDTAEYMWAEPGPASADHVYFNAFSAAQATVNANVGALETANEAPNEERPMAILGVWVDCNQDGYVGHIESALYEYSSTLLLDDSVCPPVTGDADNWTVGAHNYNGWVSELVPIGRPTTNDDGIPSDTRVYVDPESKIWADYGLPSTEVEGTGGSSCALNPFPRGTMQHTGGLLNYLDCNTGLLEVWNIAMEAGDDPLGLAFENDDDANGHALDVPTFGSDDSSHAAVSVFDCNAPPLFDGGDAVNGSAAAEPLFAAEAAVEGAWGENLVNLWAAYDQTILTPNPRTLNGADPNAPGQLNQTNEELDDCDTSNDNGQDFYGLLNEGDNIGNGGSIGKTSADWSFGYQEGTRGPLLSVRDVTIPEEWGTAGMADGTAGVSFGQTLLFGTGWYGQGNTIKVPASVDARVGLDTDDPTASNPGAEIAPGYYLSFYAYVSPVITTNLVTPGGTGIYGAEICGEAEEGLHGGWNCDVDTWNVNPDGTVEDGADLLAFVHDTYTLRDIDCYDGSTNLGVGLALPFYGDEPCQRPA